ncbi:hypothetical protein MPER_11268 [Moniliophthora perniciosa FA553]|nr:hypothetical protein MPER_11268 [Moniliophthora perniciosa FA553]
MRTFTRMYCIQQDIFSPAPPQPRCFTAEEKGKAKAVTPVPTVEETAIDDSAPVAEPPAVEADPAVGNTAICDIIDNTVQAQEEDDPTKYTAAKFFSGSTTHGGILRYDGRAQGKKGVNELQDSYMVLRTSGQGLRASEINSVYHGLNNVNTLSVCLACSMIPGGYACHFEAGKKQGCTRCIKHHLTCSNELTVERLEIMFQQIGPLISGAMPALADTFALLQAFLSKALTRQILSASSNNLDSGADDVIPTVVNVSWECLSALLNWSWTDFEEAHIRQHESLHHPPPLSELYPVPFDISPAAPPPHISFSVESFSHAISPAQLKMFTATINTAPLQMQIDAGFIAKGSTEEDRHIIPNVYNDMVVSRSPTPQSSPPPIPPHKTTKKRVAVESSAGEEEAEGSKPTKKKARVTRGRGRGRGRGKST